MYNLLRAGKKLKYRVAELFQDKVIMSMLINLYERSPLLGYRSRKEKDGFKLPQPKIG